MELITTEGGYFLVKFASLEDYEFAKYGGPWMVLDHYLIIKEWVPNFDPLTDKTETVIVWVRFSCLSMEYYDYNFLMRVGGKIGRLINIDMATSLVARAMFARICVEVDITKPLLSKFTLKRNNHEYVEEEEQTAVGDADGWTPTEEGVGSNDQNNAKGKKDLNKGNAQIIPEVTEDYGSWMVAPRKGKRYAKNQEQNNQTRNGHGKKDLRNAGKGKEKIGSDSGSKFAHLMEDNAGETELESQGPEMGSSEQGVQKATTKGPSLRETN
ncbi:uncharacterized protein LOC116020339 [Ipomoea triloba]|uniref:uncharacterized protein LOC116020339 n=1 Tax=Ipomoea triloba TaxID=35885 RepID=UPI00125D4033|nr:uncharacterized protein LOC116020339 [Ipomoea triloba]